MQKEASGVKVGCFSDDVDHQFDSEIAKGPTDAFWNGNAAALCAKLFILLQVSKNIDFGFLSVVLNATLKRPY